MSDTAETVMLTWDTPVRLADCGVEIVANRLDLGPEDVGALQAVLSGTERVRAGSFVFERDRNRFVVARARLRELLAQRLDVRPDRIELVYGAHGKPALSPRLAGSGLRFNVSHSDGVAVYAFALKREVGVDVEAIRELSAADTIAARYFSSSENEAYRSLDRKNRATGFFNCWTRKEAFIKAIGDGLKFPLNRFDVSLKPGEPARILRIEDVPGEDCGWTLCAFEPEAGFAGAVVAQKPGATERSADLGMLSTPARSSGDSIPLPTGAGRDPGNSPRSRPRRHRRPA